VLRDIPLEVETPILTKMGKGVRDYGAVAFSLAASAVCLTSSTVVVVSLTAVAVSAVPEASWLAAAESSAEEEAS
jgi:hypothetical protein